MTFSFPDGCPGGGGRSAARPLLRLIVACVVASFGGLLVGCSDGVNAEFVPVLMYHQITTDPDVEPGATVIQRSTFIEQMVHLAEEGYTTVHVDELIGYMKGFRTLPPKTVVLTFDDGWNTVLHALPILELHGLSATFNIPTGPIDDAYPGYLAWEQLEGIATQERYEFGAHSVSHPWQVDDNLVSWMAGETPGRGPADVVYEIEVPRQVLERRLERRISIFAWPSGWYDEGLVELARKAGYEGLLTVDEKVNAPGDDPMAIGRVPVDGRMDLDTFGRLLEGEVSYSTDILYPAGGGAGLEGTRN